MTTANFGEFNRDLNKRLAAQMSKMVDAQFADFQMPSPPVVEAIRKQMVGIASMNQLSDRIRKINAASMPTMPRIHIKMPQLSYVDEFSRRYGRMIFDMTEVGRHFDVDTVQSVVQGVEDGAVVVDEAAVAAQDPQILDAIDDELESFLDGASHSLTAAQRRVLRITLLVLSLITMACVFYVANDQLPPEFLSWFNATVTTLGFTGHAQAIVKWADSDDDDPE